MKTKLFLIVALFAASLSQGQIIINEDFNASTSLPAGWSSNGSGASTQSCDGNSFRRNVYNTGGNSTMTLTTPNQISASNGNDISVSVDYKVVNWSAATVATPATFGTLQLQYSVDDGSTWTTFSTIDSSNHVVSNICAPISGVIPAAAVPMNSDVKIRTLTNYNAGDYYMYNDNFVAIQGGVCLPPGGINASNVLSTSADFAWTDSTEEDAGYNWEVVPEGSGQGVGVVASGTTAANAVMVSATGLTSGTNYDFYIQSNCGGSTSSWSALLSFSTQAVCGDTLSGLCYSQTSTIEVLASFSASSGDWAEIVFNSGGTEACCDELLVYDGLNGTGNLIYGALTGGGITDVSTIGSVVSTTGNISLAINSDGSVTCSSSTSVDPISITLNCVTPPSCIAPSSLSSSNTIDVSTELSWTSGGSGETEWEVEYGAPSFTPGTGAGTIVSANSNPFTLSGLSPQTDYDVYVRAVCSPTDSSAWSGVESFTTACAVFTIPFTEGFETTATGSSFSPNAPDCWSAIDSGSGSAYVYDNSLVNVQSGSKSFRLFNSFNTTGTYMLISPQIAELTTDGVTVAFSVKGANGQELEIGTISDPSDASTFSLSETITLSSSSFEDIEVIITTSTNSYVAIRHGQTGSSDDYYLDDFSFSAVPSCIPPSSLTVSNVSFDSAQLSWTANSGEAAWEVEYGAAGFTPGTGAGTIVAANSNPFTLTSLSSNTDYEVYVRAVCSPTDSSAWSGVASFATTLDYCGGNLLTDSGGENGDYGNSENIMYTICPDNPGDKVVITFIQFSFENDDSNCYDGLTIYDGDTTTGTIIPSPGGTTDEWCWDRDDATPSGSGDLLGMSIAATAASGCITIVLDSDFSATREGFVAQVSCESTVYMWDGAAWSNTPEGSITNNDNLYVMGAGAVLTATVATDNLIVGPGASLDVNNGAIDVAGDVFNNGTILGDDEVILGGTNVTLAGTGSIENLTVSASTTAVVNGDQSIIGTLDVESSGVLDAAGAITLVSNAMGTARVDAVDAGAIIGDVNVERYIPGTNRSFRFLGSSVTGPNVFDSWQEAGANAAGFGIQVTGVVGTVGTNNAATGLDETLTGNY